MFQQKNAINFNLDRTDILNYKKLLELVFRTYFS